MLTRKLNVLVNRGLRSKVERIKFRVLGIRPHRFFIDNNGDLRTDRTIVPGDMSLERWSEGGFSDYLWQKNIAK